MIKSAFQFSDPALPVIALAIHHGHEMPPVLEENCAINPQQRLMEEDPYTGLIAFEYPNHVIVYTSRFTVDLNRNANNCIYQCPEDCWGLEVRKKPLPPVLVSELSQAYHDWYAMLAYHVDRMLKVHERLVIFDLHSYNHRRNGIDQLPEPLGSNPDINLGSSNMPSESLSHLMRLQDLLSDISVRNCRWLGDPMQVKLDCRIDIKFTGGYLTRWLHQRYSERVTAPAVEFKKIFMDEWTGMLDMPSFELIRDAFIQRSMIWAKEVTHS